MLRLLASIELPFWPHGDWLQVRVTMLESRSSLVHDLFRPSGLAEAFGVGPGAGPKGSTWSSGGTWDRERRRRDDRAVPNWQ